MTTFSAVVTTGIYCRPGCGAKPLAENVRTFEHAAAAEAAGFRACLRCRPYRTAGSIPLRDAPDLVCRAVQLIIGGALDDGTEAGLGRRLGISPRHLRRAFHEHLGLTPDQLARSRRAHFARRLLDDSDLSIADVAFASGFGSLRQFNRTMTEVFRATPRQLRQRRRKTDRLAADGGLEFRLAYTAPYDWTGLLAELFLTAVPGVESVSETAYRRTILLDGAPGMLEVTAGDGNFLVVRAHLPYWEGLIHAVDRLASLLAVNDEPRDAERRVPRVWGPFEAGVQTLAGWYAADPRPVLARLVAACGVPVPGLAHGLTHAFPAAETVAAADLSVVLPTDLADAVGGFAKAVASERIRLDGSVPAGDLCVALSAEAGFSQGGAEALARRLEAS